jgi:UV DNA damage endonuclease
MIPNFKLNKMPLQLGLCCINTQLRVQKPPVFCSRSCIRKTFTVEHAKKLASQNTRDIATMIEWNEQHDIRCFRLSSDMFPHMTDTETEKYTIDFARDSLAYAGELAKTYGHRILMHPGQYNQVGSKTRSVFEKTIEDLTHHANILDAMGIDQNGVLIVHGGGTYGDKSTTIRRWMDQFDELPQNVKNRLVIENCERQYSTRDCLYISEELGIPVVFDFHHYKCYQKIHPDHDQESIQDLLPQVVETWTKQGKRPLMHISEQGCGKIGHHSDFIEQLPSDLLSYTQSHPDIWIDVEVEAKMKEQAIFRLYDKYPFLKHSKHSKMN